MTFQHFKLLYIHSDKINKKYLGKDGVVVPGQVE